MMLAAFAAGTLAPAAVASTEAFAPAAQHVQPRSITLPRAASCGGVWVVVDFGPLGGVNTNCATSFATGLAALRSAGLAPTVEDGFIYTISGKPSKPDINKAYWSYWHATKQGDGSYSSWSYSNQGASSYQPTPGDAEGWRYVSLSDPRTPPGATPPSSGASIPTPTAGEQTPEPTTAQPTNSNTEAAQQPSAAAESDNGSGSPVGAIVVGSVVVAAAAGLGVWWTKGRRS